MLLLTFLSNFLQKQLLSGEYAMLLVRIQDIKQDFF